MSTTDVSSKADHKSAVAQADEVAANYPAYIASMVQEAQDALATIPEEDHELLRVILSRFIGPLTGQHRMDGYNLARAACGVARARVSEEWANGKLMSEGLDPIDADAPEKMIGPRRRMYRSGISGNDISVQWRQASKAGMAARLDDATLVVAIDPQSWPQIMAIVKAGPDALVRRASVFMDERAQAGRSAGTISTARAALSRLADQIVALNGMGFPHPALEPWRAAVALASAESFAAPAETYRQGIPRDDVRRLMRPWWKTIEEKTKCGTHLPPRGYFKSLRLFLVSAIMLSVGPRNEALLTMRIEDYDAEHIFPNGEKGPALQMVIGKQKLGDQPPRRWKALPPALAPYMALYMEAGNHRYQPSTWPLWVGTIYPTEAPANPDAPPTPWDARATISGSRLRYHEVLERKRKKLARRMLDDGASAPEVEAAVECLQGVTGRALFPVPGAEGPWKGHSPHQFRKYANNALAQAAEYLLERPEGAELRGAIDPYAAARAVLDQAIGNADPLGYGMGKSTQSREMMSRLLCPIVFELMVGDLGAPHGIDQARVRELKGERRDLLKLEEDLHMMLSAVARRSAEERAAAHAEGTKRMPGGLSTMTPGEVWKASQEMAARLATTLEDIERRAEDQRADLQRQLRACDKSIRRNEREIHAAETTSVPLPEEEELSWIPQIRDSAVELAADAPEADDEFDEPAPLVPVRSRLSIDEVARLLGKSVPMVRRWLNPDYLESAKRTQSGVPWTVHDLRAGRVLIEESARRRFVNADALDRTVLTAKQLQELTVLLAQPEGSQARG